MRQLPPFQSSTRTSVTPGGADPGAKSPAAVQARAAEQETANSPAAKDPAGFGAGWVAQRAPFHRSASVTRVPVLVPESPTAVQACGEVHETAVSWLPLPARPGVGWAAQRAPFHRSASVTSGPPLVNAAPTAVQAHGDVHETANSPAFWYPSSLATGWTAQRAPFHRSASGKIRVLVRLK